MKKIFSIVLVAALVITGIIGATGMSVSAADSNKYNEETLQEVYEEFTASINPQKYYDSLSEGVQIALIKTYAPEEWQTLKNMLVETTVVVTDTKGGPQTIIVTVTGYDGSLVAYYFRHTITWSWDSGYVTDIDTEIEGEGYTIGGLRWEYDDAPQYSYYTETWAPDNIWVDVESHGYFHEYVLGIKWRSFSTNLDSRVFGNGLSE